MNGNETAERYFESDLIAFYETVNEGYFRAVKETGAVTTKYYRIAGYVVRLDFCGSVIVPKISPALSHLEIKEASVSDLTIHLWDSVSTKTTLPLLVSSLVAQLRKNWWELLDIRREIKGYNGGGIHSTFHLGPDILSVLNKDKNEAVYWIEDAAQIPYYEEGYPLTSIIGGWMEQRRCHYMHAAAMGMDGKGVLIPGDGGAGKSTTALACLNSELQFLSDDYCLLAFQPEPTVHALYNTTKLKGEDDIRRFPLLREKISNPDHLEEEKAMIYLHHHFPEKIVRQLNVKAILLPRITGLPRTEVKPAKAVEALLTLAPSTLFQLPGSGPHTFHAFGRLVKEVPIFRIELGTEIERIPGVISGLIDELAG
jgi:hypothetical protein